MGFVMGKVLLAIMLGTVWGAICTVLRVRSDEIDNSFTLAFNYVQNGIEMVQLNNNNNNVQIITIKMTMNGMM